MLTRGVNDRVRYFASEISREAPYHLEGDQKLTTPRRGVVPWPSDGVVTFRKVSARYRPGLPRVLKDLSLNVGAAQKVRYLLLPIGFIVCCLRKRL